MSMDLSTGLTMALAMCSMILIPITVASFAKAIFETETEENQ